MNGNCIQTVKTFLRKCFLWFRLKILQLTENIGVYLNIINECFVNWIKQLFYNDSLININKITFSKYMEIMNLLFNLIDVIYLIAIIENVVCNWIHFTDWTILTSLNDIVSKLNNRILNKFSKEDRMYESINTHDVNDKNGLTQIPSEFLKHVDFLNLSSLKLRFKVKMFVICLWNMFSIQKLCNEFREIVIKMQKHNVMIRLLNEDFVEKIRILFQTKLNINENEFFYILTRKQFSIKIYFTMTINKAQNQSFNKIGIDLRHLMFTHGQFYVAVLRATNAKDLHFLLSKKQIMTNNITYSEILTMFNETWWYNEIKLNHITLINEN